MIRKFNEYISEGFYYPESDENSHDDEMNMGSMPEESGEEDPSWNKKPEMKIGDYNTRDLFRKLDNIIIELMQETGMSMREIMDHIADVADSYSSKPQRNY